MNDSLVAQQMNRYRMRKPESHVQQAFQRFGRVETWFRTFPSLVRRGAAQRRGGLFIDA
jgi:hypothetical protein